MESTEEEFRVFADVPECFLCGSVEENRVVGQSLRLSQ